MNIGSRIIIAGILFIQVHGFFAQTSDFKWAVKAGGRFSDASSDVTIDNAGNIITTGYFSNIATFGNTQLTSAGSGDIFIAKYDSNGNLIWAVKAGGTGYDEAFSVTTDKLNNIIITGKFAGQATFGTITIQSSGNGNFSDVFVAKCSPDGNFLWVKKGGGDYGDSGEDIKVDDSDNIYVSGIYTLSAVFDDISLPEVEAYGTFIAKYNPSGNIQWIRSLEGGIPFNVYDIYYTDTKSNSIAVSNNGIFVSGTFTNKIVIEKDTLVSEGDWDTFIAKYNPDGTFAWVKQIKGGLVWTFDTKADDNGNLFITGTFETKASFDNINLTSRDSLNFFNSFIAKYNQQGNPIWAIQDSSFGWSTRLTLNNSEKISVIGSQNLYNDIYIGQYDFIGNKIWSNVIINSSNQIPGGIIDDNKGNIIISGGFSGQLNLGSLTLISDGDSSDIFVSKLSPTSNILVTDISGTFGENVKIIITPPKDFLYTSVQFFYRKNGELNYQQTIVSDSGNSQFAVIPSEYSTIRGIQYYVVFSNGETTITFPKDDPVNHPASIQVNIPEFIYPIKPEPSVYQMISVPLSLSIPSLGSVFENNYGTYNKNIWRLFRWNDSDSGYSEYPNIISNLQPGNAFWLINSEGKSFVLRNAFSVQDDNGCTITLLPGWNQIGNPFAFPVAWDSIQNSDMVQGPIAWNTSTEDYELDQEILQPWTGYWINNPLSEEINLVVPQVESSVLPKKNSSANISQNEFIVQIKASISPNIHDTQNFVGMLNKIQEGSSGLEILKPPSVKDNLRICITNEGKEYAQYIVPVSSEGAYWDLRIISNLTNENIKLEFEKKSSLPKDFNIWFFDKNRMLSIPVVENKVALHLPKNGMGLFRLITGKEEFTRQNSEQIPLVPIEYTLFQNYPNPFNLTTNIVYNLREKSQVTIEVYDILGRLIKILVNNEIQNPGTHNLMWDGTNSNHNYTSSGIYIYRLRANNFSDSKMMVLLK
jgi:hypothetical protein